MNSIDEVIKREHQVYFERLCKLSDNPSELDFALRRESEKVMKILYAVKKNIDLNAIYDDSFELSFRYFLIDLNNQFESTTN